MKHVVYSFAALLFAAVAFSSCAKEQDTLDEQTPELKTYSLTIEASKGIDTKQLVLDGNTLNAVWGAGEVVKVYKGSDEIGTLTPQTTGSAEAVLTGTVTVAGLNADDWIDLVYGGDLTGQDGSLATLSSSHDYAKAWFQVGSISGNKIVPKPSIECADAEGKISFVNWEAIVRFNVKKGGSAFSVSKMEIIATTGSPINDGAKKLTITPGSNTSELYVALHNYDGDTPVSDNYEIVVTDPTDGREYFCKATGKSFLRDQFYSVTLNVVESTYTVAGEPYESVFGGDKNWDQTRSENNLAYSAGVYSKTFNVTAAAEVNFKVVRNYSWDSASWPGSNYYYKFPSAGSLTISYNPSTNEVTATGTTTKTYTVAGTSTQSGVFTTDWAPSDEGNDMTLTSDGSYYKVFPGLKKDKTITFKVAVNHTWGTSYGYRTDTTNCANDGGNCVWTVTKDSDVRIWINPGSTPNDHYIYVEEI